MIDEAERRGMASAIREAIDLGCAKVRDDLRRELSGLRDEVSVLRSALAGDDAPTRAVLDALASERRALDTLIADAERLTGGEVRERLAAMKARLCRIDGTLPH